MQKKRISVVGLGLMGTALTERLLDGGYEVYVFNRTRSKADPLIRRGARWSDNPLADADRVIVSLFTTETVREVLGKFQAALRPGKIVIDTTTGAPDETFSLYDELQYHGVEYLDAPISGSSEQTRCGQAVAIVGGDRETFDSCGDILACIVRDAIYVGPSGSGSKMKLVTNLVLGLNRAALAEGLVFAQQIGIDPQRALEVLIGSAAYSRQMDGKGAKMVKGDFTPQARLAQHCKDVDLILAAAKRAGVTKLPLTGTHRELLAAAESAGYADADNSAIIRAIEEIAHGQS